MERRYYYTRDKNGNPRHVVVTMEEPEGDTVSVERVGFHPTVTGTNRRGRPPTLNTLPLSQLTEMSEDEVTDELRTQADRVLSSAASNDDLN